MNRSLRWLYAAALCLVLLVLPQLAAPAQATEPADTTAATTVPETTLAPDATTPPEATEVPENREAVNISDRSTVTNFSGFRSIDFLFDKNDTKSSQYPQKCSMTLEHADGIGSLYLVFLTEYGSYTLTDNATGTEYVVEDALLHDFVDVQAAFGTAPTSVTVTFPKGNLALTEVYIFTPGQVPAFVQQWKLPEDGKTDLVLFSTHGDDEQLFFAGILPYYAKELGYQVQVVYLTDHHNFSGTTRQREMLDGLWAVGVDTYPVFGTFKDFRIDNKEATYNKFKQYGVSKDDLVGYVVENIRRFKPKVVVGHDFKGEYGHGQHQVYAEVLSIAVGLSMDETQFPESAATYGVWDVPKAYFHLYKENPIVMDWDQPMESFDGMTPYEVTIKLGFQKHKSQVPYFSWYYSGANKASQIKQYSPCEFGLFRSTVGEDVEKNDFFENVTTHARDAELEAIRKAEEEAARIAAELEAKRKAEEEAAAREAARLAVEEAAAQEAAKEARNRNIMMMVLWSVSIGLVIVAIPLARFGKKRS